MMKIWIRPVVLTCILALSKTGYGQHFKGTVVYEVAKYDSVGQKQYFPQEREELLITSDKMLTRILSGHIKYALNSDVLLDITNGKLYSINHNDEIVYDIVNNPCSPLNTSSVRDKGSEELLGTLCVIKEFIHFNKYSGDPVISQYWIPVDSSFRIKELERFAALQGCQNTMFLDGRFGALPLRVKLNYPNGDHIVIQVVSILDEVQPGAFDMPRYPVKRSAN